MKEKVRNNGFDDFFHTISTPINHLFIILITLASTSGYIFS